MRRGALLLVLVAGCHHAPKWAEPPTNSAPGEPTISGAPVAIGHQSGALGLVLDGKLDEPAWASAALLGPLVDPGGGQAAPNNHPVYAWARMLWDDRALYVGIVVRDTHPDSPFTADSVDPHVWGASSGVELMLQPGDLGDNRDYYELQVDVNRAVFDSHFDDYNAPITIGPHGKVFGHQEWQSGVERAVYVERGHFYAIELALPWSALGEARVAVPPHPGDVWRLNLYSFRDGQRAALAWSPLRGQGNFHKTARFGRVKF